MLRKIIAFIRFKILHISTKYIYMESKFLNYDTDLRFATVPGMSDNSLRNFCFRYASQQYSGKGDLVDLGSWLGATVVPLCEGLRINPAFSFQHHHVHCYDEFIWYENMTKSIVHFPHADKRYTLGDSFVDGFCTVTRPYQDLIVIHQADLTTATWETKPIEYLMIDAMKNWEIARNITIGFYPYIIAHAGIIIHEDFCHYYTSWIHLIHYRLKGFFEPVDDMSGSSAKAFRCIKPLNKAVLEKIIPQRFDEFSTSEIYDAFDYSLSLVLWYNKPSILAAKAMAFRHKGDYATAKKCLRDINLLARIVNDEVAEATEVILQHR